MSIVSHDYMIETIKDNDYSQIWYGINEMISVTQYFANPVEYNSKCTRKRPQMYEITPSRKRLRTKVTQDLHLTYSKNGGNLGLVLND